MIIAYSFIYNHSILQMQLKIKYDSRHIFIFFIYFYEKIIRKRNLKKLRSMKFMTFLFAFWFLTLNYAIAQDGKAIFKSKCSADGY